jgi:hypothetical protein
MPQKLSAFRERKLRFDASKAVRFSRIRHCINASLPQNRVRFSRPVKKNQGLTIVAKAEKTLSAYWLPRRRRKGSGSTTPLIAAQETWGSGTASPPASTERDVVVEHAPPRSQEHPSSVTTRLPPSQTLRITSQVQDRQRAVREALGLPPPPHRARPDTFPLTRSWRLFTRPAHPENCPPLLVNPAPDHPRSIRLTHRVLRTTSIEIDTEITTPCLAARHHRSTKHEHRD